MTGDVSRRELDSEIRGVRHEIDLLKRFDVRSLSDRVEGLQRRADRESEARIQRHFGEDMALMAAFYLIAILAIVVFIVILPRMPAKKAIEGLERRMDAIEANLEVPTDPG